MILWIDAQLSPALAPWIAEQFGIEAYSVKWLGYLDIRKGGVPPRWHPYFYHAGLLELEVSHVGPCRRLR